MRKILLLGGSAQQVVAIETAKRLGYYTVLCDFLPDNPGKFSADRFYLVSTTDKDAILKVAQEEKIDGILAYASDPAAPTAAYVAEKMNLRTNPYQSIETLCNKDLFRRFLSSNGFHTPKAEGFSSVEEAKSQISNFDFPIIIKPVDSSGSKGATVLRSLEGLDDALDFAFSFSRCKRIVVEEFVEKKHPYLIGGDIFIENGEVVLWGLLNCHRDSNVNPLVPVGKSYPLELDPVDIDRAKHVLQTLVDKLGIQFGAMNVELIIDKQDRVFLIDIGPRNGGNMIPDLLGMIFNVDVVEMTVRAAMGQSSPCCPSNETGYYATHNLHSDRDGIFEDILFSQRIEPFIVKKCIYKKKGSHVEYFDNAAKALGIIFLHFENQNEMRTCLSELSEEIQVLMK